MEVPNARKASVRIVTENALLKKGILEIADSAKALAAASEFVVQKDTAGIADSAVSLVIPDAVVYLPLEELVDLKLERERLIKEADRLTGEIKRASGMLSNEKFVNRAPADKVQAERDKLEKYQSMYDEVCKRLAALPSAQ